MNARFGPFLALSLLTAGSTRAAPVAVQLESAGSTVPVSTDIGGDVLAAIELDLAMLAGDADSSDGEPDSLGPQPIVNRSIARGHAVISSVDGTQANTGRYAWTVPAGLPLKVFLKITAEDKSGNVGEAVTPQPLAVDLHKPVGRIRAIAGKPKS